MVRMAFTNTLSIRGNSLHLFIAFYFAYNAFLFAVAPHADKAYFVNLTFLILLFFITALVVSSRKQYLCLLYLLAFTVIVSSIYGLLQLPGHDYPLSTRLLGKRIFSFFGNPNLFAAFLVVNLPLLFSGFFTGTRLAKKLFALSIGLAVLGLLLTGTRAALLGATISAALFFVLTWRESDQKRYLWAVSTVAVLVMAGFLYSTQTTEIRIAGLSLRQYEWGNTLKIARDHPIFGTGVGSFNVYYPAYREKSAEIDLGLKNHELRVEHAHNEFLEILSDSGIVGFLLFSGILLAFFYNHYLRWHPKRQYLLAGNCCAVMGILIHSLYSVNLRFPFVAMFFWLCLGLQSTLLDQPRAAAKATFSAGKIVASLLLLPLLALFFFNHSLARFSAEHHFKEGLAHYIAKDYRQAETRLESALANYPQDKSSLYFLGMAEHRLKKFSESQATFLELIRLDPNFLQSHYWLATNYFSTGDFEKAKQEYRESLRVNNAFGPSYYALGIISLTENDLEQATNHLEQAYTLPGDRRTADIRLDALRKLIAVHRQQGNWQTARSYVEELDATLYRPVFSRRMSGKNLY